MALALRPAQRLSNDARVRSVRLVVHGQDAILVVEIGKIAIRLNQNQVELASRLDQRAGRCGVTAFENVC
eukprot:5875392-Pleurochrysis_carterae.AAC.1